MLIKLCIALCFFFPETWNPFIKITVSSRANFKQIELPWKNWYIRKLLAGSKLFACWGCIEAKSSTSTMWHIFHLEGILEMFGHPLLWQNIFIENPPQFQSTISLTSRSKNPEVLTKLTCHCERTCWHLSQDLSGQQRWNHRSVNPLFSKTMDTQPSLNFGC